MAEITAGPRVARRSPIEYVVDRIWRFFCSVRAAIYEIAILALMVLAGTLRGSSVPRWIADAIPVTEQIVDRWYSWDVFHSLPFMLILATLSIAIAICTINRAPGIWRTIADPTVGTTRGFLASADTSATLQTPGPPPDLAHQIGGILRTRRYRVLTEQRGDEIHLYADRHRYAKLGTFPFHLALILILVGGIVGARYGFRETEFIVPEGSTREIGHGTGLSVGLERFTESYRENGMAEEYRSDLILYKDGKEVKEGSITVNNPLTYRSIVIYQASFGQAVTLMVTGKNGQVLYDDSVPLGIYRSTTNEDAPAGLLQLPQADAQINIIAPDENPANRPDLDLLGLRSGEMFIQLRQLAPDAPAEMPAATVGQGETIQLGDINVTFVRERRFTLLQVGSNPGIPIFFAAAFLLVGGLVITFYFPHRRVRGIISPALAAGAATAQLAPLAKRDWSGKRDFYRVVDDLEAKLGTRPTLHVTDDRDVRRAEPPQSSHEVEAPA